MNEPDASKSPAPAPKGGVLGTLALGLGVVAMKLKGGVGLLKGLSFGKMLPTALSMLLMVWVEAQRHGLWFAVGFVLLILLHELGHGFAIRRAGLEAGWPLFIPFVGASISLKGQVPSAAVEAEIAYGGPLAGTAASLVCAGLGLAQHSRFMLALAHTGFFLNLFNLIPLSPLDGGRVAQAFSRRSWFVGAILLGLMFLVSPSIQLAMIAGLGVMQALRGGSLHQHPEVSAEEQRAWALRYFGLCFFLGAALLCTSRLLNRHA